MEILGRFVAMKNSLSSATEIINYLFELAESDAISDDFSM